jgi:hypothetical protein
MNLRAREVPRQLGVSVSRIGIATSPLGARIVMGERPQLDYFAVKK